MLKLKNKNVYRLREDAMEDLRQQIEKRRTFAIISHPDAGKTTLTEKFLLYGGAIQQAGTVKGRGRVRACKRKL